MNPSDANFARRASLSRPEMLLLLNTAIAANEYRYARQLALSWRSVYPGDLMVTFLLSKNAVREGKSSQALPALQKITELDPQFIEAYRLLNEIASPATADLKQIRTALALLDEKGNTSFPDTPWSKSLSESRRAADQKDLDRAEEHIHQSLVQNPDSPLPALVHLYIAEQRGDALSVQNLAQMYHERWQNCLQFSLYLADSLIKTGEDIQSVALLHQCASRDTAAQVPMRMWGKSFPYRSIWNLDMSIPNQISVPASVASSLGWNRLPDKTFSTPIETQTPTEQIPVEEIVSAPVPTQVPTATKNAPWDDPVAKESLRSVEAELDRLAKRMKRPAVSHADGRFPVFVVMSTRQGLTTQYGPQTAQVLIDEMSRLVQLTRSKPGWGSLLFLPDDPSSIADLGVKSVPFNDAWKLKLSLADLDTALSKKGQMIGALFIVGGPKVVPYHHLPNPADDGDTDVASDNPYASRDENYFVPEWPVGRLPAPSGSDAGLLLKALRNICSDREKQHENQPWWMRLISIFWYLNRSTAKGLKSNFGYTAAVWKSSSEAVYQPIGDTRSLLVSPPVCTGELSGQKSISADLAYFNLHGIPDGAGWYGQRTAEDTTSVDYPVALTPQDISNNGRAPRIVFSEACYGANIENKTEEDAIALKFLNSGTSAMVGSTCIAYGTVTTPLIAADYLGNSFWKQIRAGVAAGIAFQQSKINLATEMTNRQGFLDGEDQKTLISFVLLGDPLAVIQSSSTAPKTVLREREHARIKTATILPATNEEEAAVLTPETLAKVKEVVNHYLPGLSDAELTLGVQHIVNGNVSSKIPTPSAKVVTLSKQIRVDRFTHQSVAHLTLNSEGKVVKIAVSR
jgi:tetratricopeptide (TPR) repeat protein